jgi:hypothetical protein
MAEQSQTSHRKSGQTPWQAQQAGEAPRAPQSAWEAAAPRLKRATTEPDPSPITDWASI